MKAGPKDVGCEQDASKDQESDGALCTGRVVMAHGAQLEARVDEDGLDLFGAKLIVAETGQGDRVTKVLLERDGVVEDDERGADEEDVLEDAGHGKNNGGCLANLY